MAASRSIPQSREVLLKSYNIRLKEDCKIMLENYFGECWLFGLRFAIGVTKKPQSTYFTFQMRHGLTSLLCLPSEIIKLAKGENDSQLSKITQYEQDTYEMQVRAANIGKWFNSSYNLRKIEIDSDVHLFKCVFSVRAGESLMKLVSDIKQYLILNDFHSVNDAITANSQLFRSTQLECDRKLMNLREAAAIDLYDLEEEYYTSEFK